MKWLRRFLKLRKQRDDVKILFALFLLGVLMLGRTIYYGVSIYRDICTPVEYVLSAGGTQKITELELKELRDTDYVANVGIEKRTELIIKNGAQEAYMECLELPASYLEEVYGVKNSGAMKTFYLTPKAYEVLLEGQNKVNQKSQYEYLLGEEKGKAKIVVLDSKLFSEDIYAFCQGSATQLAEESEEIRVYATRKDFDGMTIRHFENLGYFLENIQVVLELEYSRQFQFQQIMYETIIGVLCFGFVLFGMATLKKRKCI